MLEESAQPTGITGSHEQERRAALAIFRYLLDLAKLRTSIVRDLKAYEHCFWLDVLRDKPGCASRCFRSDEESSSLSAGTTEDDLWIEVRKMREPVMPPFPEAIQPWIADESGKSPDSPPRLLDRLPGVTFVPKSKIAPKSPESGSSNQAESTSQGDSRTEDSGQFESLEDHPQVRKVLSDYLESHWFPWAEAHAAWKAFQEAVYSPLFAIHRDLKRLGEEFELVLGIGCLTWRTSIGHQVKRHLVVSQVSLEFDPANGLFKLLPGADGAKLALEIDMLEPTEQPSVSQLDAVRHDLSEAQDDPWDFESVDRALAGVAHAIDENGTYTAMAYRPAPLAERPEVTFSPALLLRRRTSRGLIVTLEAIIEQLMQGGQIPPWVRRLTKAASGGPRVDDGRSPSGSAPTSRTYFPLSANEEQRQIVDRLASKHGVLVQGPPGTGKSHTIANLICHLLATGSRVLITAQTPRALQVLREKLPSEIRPLCLSVLGNDKAAQDNVEESVRRVIDEADAWNSTLAAKEIKEAEDELDQLTAREAMLEADLRTFREAEIHKHTIADGAYSGTAQRIAECVWEDATRFEWFTDKAEPDTPIPVSAEDLTAYREGMIHFDSPRAAELELRRPTRGTDLPAGDMLVRTIQIWHQLHDRIRSLAPAVRHFGAVSLDELREARSALRRLQAATQQVSVSAGPWVSSALTEVLRGAGGGWDIILNQTDTTIREYADIAPGLDRVDIRLPADRRSDVLYADMSDLLSHFQRGRGLGLPFFRARAVRRARYIWKEATVDGRPCDNMSAVALAKQYLECMTAVRNAWALWDGIAVAATKMLGQQIQELRELNTILAKITSIRPLVAAVTESVARLQLVEVPLLEDLRALDSLAAACDHEIERREYDAATAVLNKTIVDLRSLACSPDAHPTCAILAEHIEQRDLRAVEAVLADIDSLEADARRLANWMELKTAIVRVLPNFAEAVAKTSDDSAWPGRIREWTAAWRWAKAKAWLAKFTDSRHASAVESELQQTKERIKVCVVRASAKRAWDSCLSTMSPAHKQHLNAWRQANKKIGKGTGKHAGHWRRVAQAELEQCRAAIPAWVMPLYRVFDSLKPAPVIFDVVIVDEASQCGPESLVLFYFAKQIIVVGDDKQISPSNVGIDKDATKRLLEQHLDGIDFANTFDVDSSLFDHGQVRLGAHITLREHFRCMPDIIRFSNDLCYNGVLIPLRQYPAESRRLAPYLARYVKAGTREGGSQSARNEAEAEAIVAAIAACCADPMYKDKTIGVISLLGDHQAKLIERRLLGRIGAEQIERRRIVCGDAYSFQGDERHIVFLSLVVANKSSESQGFSALTKRSDMQRFNVAASRAQDQLWLFHSIMPEDIGNAECMRQRLLTYFYDPALHAEQAIGLDRADLRQKLKRSKRQGPPPVPFDSWFEVEVYLRIADRGFRVLPQYKAGRHSIDLVVEGSSRFAIECDGDRWHGPERFDEDMARQRQLERAGWRFMRIRGSAFEYDPQAALEPLWNELSELGIEPEPAIDGTGSSDGYFPHMANLENVTVESRAENRQASA